MSIRKELLQDHINMLIDELKKAEAENARLKEQVERLTKAGDLMANRLMYQGYHLTIPQWNEAKDKYPRR
jgi:predicted nuclease with TOPRIM domain